MKRYIAVTWKKQCFLLRTTPRSSENNNQNQIPFNKGDYVYQLPQWRIQNEISLPTGCKVFPVLGASVGFHSLQFCFACAVRMNRPPRFYGRVSVWFCFFISRRYPPRSDSQQSKCDSRNIEIIVHLTNEARITWKSKIAQIIMHANLIRRTIPVTFQLSNFHLDLLSICLRFNCLSISHQCYIEKNCPRLLLLWLLFLVFIIAWLLRCLCSKEV